MTVNYFQVPKKRREVDACSCNFRKLTLTWSDILVTFLYVEYDIKVPLNRMAICRNMISTCEPHGVGQWMEQNWSEYILETKIGKQTPLNLILVFFKSWGLSRIIWNETRDHMVTRIVEIKNGMKFFRLFPSWNETNHKAKIFDIIFLKYGSKPSYITVDWC